MFNCIMCSFDRLQELEHSSAVQHEEFQRQRAQDAGLVETLRLSLKSYEDALNAERKEHQNTKYEGSQCVNMNMLTQSSKRAGASDV